MIILYRGVPYSYFPHDVAHNELLPNVDISLPVATVTVKT